MSSVGLGCNLWDLDDLGGTWMTFVGLGCLKWDLDDLGGTCGIWWDLGDLWDLGYFCGTWMTWVGLVDFGGTLVTFLGLW